MEIFGYAPETFVSLRDTGIPINGEYLCKYTTCWQNLVNFRSALPIHPSQTKFRWLDFILKMLVL